MKFVSLVRRTTCSAVLAGALSASIGSSQVQAQAGPTPLILERGSWTAFCDNSGGCGMANMSTRRGSYAVPAEGELPWVCFWLGASDTFDASFSVLFGDGTQGSGNAMPRELVIQSVLGRSEYQLGVPATARLGDDGRYHVDSANIESLAADLGMADAALLREPNGGPVFARLSLDGFAAALRYARARRTIARPLPEIVPMPFAPVSQVDPQRSRDLHRRHCGNDLQSPRRVEAFRLSADRQLWTLNCRMSGLYNLKVLALIAGPRGEPSELVLQSIVDYEGIGPDFDNLIVNPALGLIEDYRRSRGVGDCGIRRSWAWTGEAFRLASEEFMPHCFHAVRAQWLRMHTSAGPGIAMPQRPPC
jgi:hypothetical protein